MKRKMVESCEMCSIDIHNPITIKVEGALLRVCHKCSSYGNIVKERSPMVAKKTLIGRRTTPRSTIQPKRRFSSTSNKTESELDDNFAKLIRGARQKKNLSHEKLSAITGITVATLKSVESGKMRPTDRDARKIARELSIKLFITLDTELEYTEKKKRRATTLGDIAVIKKYEYDKD